MNVQLTASAMLQRFNLKDIEAGQRPGDETSSRHLAWMLRGIIDGYIQHEKAHRWLGFIQGVLVGEKSVTVDELKHINHDT